MTKEVSRLEHDDRSLRLAYADPPYPGLEHYYRGHPDFGATVDLRQLLLDMHARYDGWALSTSAFALPRVLVLARDLGLRPSVASWVRSPRKTRSRHPLSSWEPVLYVRARSAVSEDQVADSLICTPRARTTDPGRVIGAKPPQFVTWVLGLLGARANDQLDDLFPGSGMVTRVWKLATQDGAA